MLELILSKDRDRRSEMVGRVRVRVLELISVAKIYATQQYAPTGMNVIDTVHEK